MYILFYWNANHAIFSAFTFSIDDWRSASGKMKKMPHRIRTSRQEGTRYRCDSRYDVTCHHKAHITTWKKSLVIQIFPIALFLINDEGDIAILWWYSMYIFLSVLLISRFLPFFIFLIQLISFSLSISLTVSTKVTSRITYAWWKCVCVRCLAQPVCSLCTMNSMYNIPTYKQFTLRYGFMIL